MPFALSPRVIVTERDLTTIVPAVATTDAAIAGVFAWGPVDKRTLVDSELTLRDLFWKPSGINYETWFTAADFLGYGSREYVVRVANTSVDTPTGDFTPSGGAANTVIDLIGANATYSPVTLGINSTMTVLWSNNTTTVPVDAAVASVNDTSVVLVNATGDGANVSLGFVHVSGAYNALAPFSGGIVNNVAAQGVKNSDDYDDKDGTFDTDLAYIAKYPGAIGNSLRISVCDSANSYLQTINLSWSNTTDLVSGTTTIGVGNTNFVVTFTSNTGNTESSNTVATSFISSIQLNDLLEVGNTSIGRQYLKVTSIDGTPTTNATVSTVNVGYEDPYRLSTPFVANSFQRYWEFYNVVDVAPGQSDHVLASGNTLANDELHVVVVDNDGKFTGTPGTILEVFRNLSRATDSKVESGATNYYKSVINDGSRYVWLANDRGNAASANAYLVASSTNSKALDINFIYGADGEDESNISFGLLAQGYDRFSSPEDVDISLVLQGKPRGGVDPTTGVTDFQLANYIIDNICEIRKDCVGFFSPELSTNFNNDGAEALTLVDWRNALRSTSYGVLDSGYKKRYDKYNDVYRWTPLNGDIAGLCARTDQTNDPWWSPAGLNRGQIKNVVHLAWNPRLAERDILYKSNVNAVTTFKGQGTVLWGDKTLLTKPSAFDRINVRRLFIVLEKAIATAAKYFLFEFNDEFTRAQFRNLVVPYLRDVKGRRGIYEFLVVCDETNNTPQIIDTNNFVGDIYIKPTRSINWVTLNFIAVGTGVSFSEIVGGPR